jgi:hypothetical protein
MTEVLSDLKAELQPDKLTGYEDWWEWKYVMTLQLKSRKWWNHVDGTAQLEAEATAEQRANFEHTATRAHAMIVRGLSKQVTSLVLNCHTAKEVWDRLVREYEVKSVQNSLLLRTKVNQMRLKEGGVMKMHLNAMKEVYNQLAMLDDAVAERDQVVSLLASLPSSYNAIRSVLLTKGDEITWVEVEQSLLMEEQQRELQKKKKEDSTEKTVQGAMKAEMKCFRCHKPGHFKRDCPEAPKENPQGRKFGGRGGYSHRGRGRGRGSFHGANQVQYDHEMEEPHVLFHANTTSGVKTGKQRWLIDSGASRHMTSQKECLEDYVEFEKGEPVTLGDGKTVQAIGKGNVKLQLGSQSTGTLQSVLYVPHLSCNLLSVGAAADQNLVVEFNREGCRFRDLSGQTVATGTRITCNRMYQLNIEETVKAHVALQGSQLWHQRLAHLNEADLKKMVEKKLVDGINIGKEEKLKFCEACVGGKSAREPFRSGEIKSSEILDLVHSDVCGPMQTKSLGGSYYFITFIDDFSRCVRVYTMKKKDEAFDKFREYEALMRNHTGKKIRTLRTDGGGEYTSSKFENFLKQKGIRHEICSPYSPQQNGVAERMNRTLMEAARSMLINARLSKMFWAEAVTTAAYIRNRTLTSSTGVTPYERWHGRKPDVSHLKVFGCVAHALLFDHERRKLDPKTKKVRFIGYSLTTKGYRLYDVQKRQLFIRRDVKFEEDNFGEKRMEVKSPDIWFEDVKTTEQGGASGGEEDEAPEETKEESTERSEEFEEKNRQESEDSAPLRRTSRSTAGMPPKKFADEFSYHHHFAYYAGDVDVPLSLKDARQSKESEDWQQATDAEYNSLMKNRTWVLAELPEGRKAVSCKWVFRLKYDKMGEIERYKTRLVAKGYSQQYGIDYEETFSPVVRFTSIRVLLAFAANNDMDVHQMDVTTAFLNGDLQEDIYMLQPEGYVQPGKENLVCHLKKAIYGLKQAPRKWNRKLVEFLERIGFEQSYADPCIFVRQGQKSTDLCILAVYVDDIIILTKEKRMMTLIKKQLKEGFQMKDLGELHFILGVEVDRTSEGISLSQQHFVKKLLVKFGMAEAKTAPTPMDTSVQLQREDGYSKPVDNVLYQSIIGSLLYIAMVTRPDIAYAVGVLGRFAKSPTEAHLTAAKRVLRYLKGTDLKLSYKQQVSDYFVGYSDADWGSSMDDRKSTTGSVFILAGGAVSWMSKKQSLVALSTTEAEYIALSSASQEAVWLQRLMKDIGQEMQMKIQEDNQSAIRIAQNPVFHSRTKHIDIKTHYVHELVTQGTISLEYCASKENIADIFTKPLAKTRFTYLREKLGLE